MQGHILRSGVSIAVQPAYQLALQSRPLMLWGKLCIPACVPYMDSVSLSPPNTMPTWLVVEVLDRTCQMTSNPT